MFARHKVTEGWYCTSEVRSKFVQKKLKNKTEEVFTCGIGYQFSTSNKK